jgi:hypothetical protein
MRATIMEDQLEKPFRVTGKVAVSLIHHDTGYDTSRHKVLVSGNEQGLRSLAQLLRRLANGSV